MRLKGVYTIRNILACLLLLTSNVLQADENVLATKKVYLEKNKGTIYELLQQISQQTGLYFIYDSQLINNDQVVKIKKGEYSIKDAVYAITSNPRLEIRLTNSHILIYGSKKESRPPKVEEPKQYSIEGVLYDRITQEAIPYCLISIKNTNISTASNQNGKFKLIIPDSLRHAAIRFSHLGYQSKELLTDSLTNQQLILTLDPQYTPLQEVVVRSINPTLLLKKMVEHYDKNYSHKPVRMTTFYREIIEYKKNKSLTEGVLGLYKTDYNSPQNKDQAKLIKIRKILSQQEKDTILVKVKAGIEGALTLDIIKNPLDFLTPRPDHPYQYLHTDITSIDDRSIYVISFQQKEFIHEPLYKGQLFIDAESYALVEARFEVNPLYIIQNTSTYVLKQPKTHKITLQQALYTISYKPDDNGTYYLNQVRGDILFKVKKKKSLFSSALNVSFEMITCDIQTKNIKTFAKDERLQVHRVFSETKHPYDPDFWGDFNTIVPEEELKKFIMNNLSEVLEESGE